jgi:hypothetical protein
VSCSLRRARPFVVAAVSHALELTGLGPASGELRAARLRIGSWTTVTTDCSTSPVPGKPACSTGQFAGLGGLGTNTMHFAGAHLAGSYNGTLG